MFLEHYYKKNKSFIKRRFSSIKQRRSTEVVFINNIQIILKYKNKWFKCFIQQIMQNVILNFLYFVFYLIKFKNKKYFIEEVKLSNKLSNNEQKSIQCVQCVQCFQYSIQFEANHSIMNILNHLNITSNKSFQNIK
jgi:hypothetical protein